MGEYSFYLDLYPPPFSCYNTSPHRKIINRWVGWEQLPARAARYLGKQASLLWFPGWREEDRPQLDCPSHWEEPEKPDKIHRYLSLLSLSYQLYTPSHKSEHTNQGTESKTSIFSKGTITTDHVFCVVHYGWFWCKKPSMIGCCGCLSCAHSWIVVDSPKLAGLSPCQSSLQTNTDC